MTLLTQSGRLTRKFTVGLPVWFAFAVFAACGYGDPPPPPVNVQRPPASENGFVESVGARLSYRLDLPTRHGKVPAVVIGHGSGRATKDACRYLASGFLVARLRHPLLRQARRWRIHRRVLVGWSAKQRPDVRRARRGHGRGRPLPPIARRHRRIAGRPGRQQPGGLDHSRRGRTGEAGIHDSAGRPHGLGRRGDLLQRHRREDGRPTRRRLQEASRVQGRARLRSATSARDARRARPLAAWRERPQHSHARHGRHSRSARGPGPAVLTRRVSRSGARSFRHAALGRDRSLARPDASCDAGSGAGWKRRRADHRRQADARHRFSVSIGSVWLHGICQLASVDWSQRRDAHHASAR